MKFIDFDQHLNQWFIPMVIEGENTKAYLDVHFEENRENAFQKALEIRDTLTNHFEEELLEVPMGTLDEYHEDFRCLI